MHVNAIEDRITFSVIEVNILKVNIIWTRWNFLSHDSNNNTIDYNEHHLSNDFFSKQRSSLSFLLTLP